MYAHLPKTLQMSRADPNTHKVPRQACDIESTKQQHMIQNSLSVQTPIWVVNGASYQTPGDA